MPLFLNRILSASIPLSVEALVASNIQIYKSTSRARSCRLRTFEDREERHAYLRDPFKKLLSEASNISSTAINQERLDVLFIRYRYPLSATPTLRERLHIKLFIVFDRTLKASTTKILGNRERGHESTPTPTQKLVHFVVPQKGLAQETEKSPTKGADRSGFCC